MNISIIVAASKNNVIGNKNQLPWHLPNDMKFFKQTTWAMPIVMGRKTFESIGSKPLKGRFNIIITKQSSYNSNGASVVNSFENAIELAKKNDYKEIIICGGGEIYKEAMPIAHKIFITRVDTIIDGDTFFEMDINNWTLVFKEPNLADEKHKFNYCFETWIRN